MSTQELLDLITAFCEGPTETSPQPALEETDHELGQWADDGGPA